MFPPRSGKFSGWFVTISFTTIGGSMWITHFWECNIKNVWNNQPNDVLLHGMCLCVCVCVYIHVQLFWTHLAFKHTTHHPFACLNSSQGTDQEWHDVVQKARRTGCSCWFRDVWLMVMDTSDTQLGGFQPFCWLKSVETLRKMPEWKLVMSDMGLTAWLWAEPTDRHGACQSWETWTRLSPFESVMLCVWRGARLRIEQYGVVIPIYRSHCKAKQQTLPQTTNFLSPYCEWFSRTFILLKFHPICGRPPQPSPKWHIFNLKYQLF